MLWKLGARMHQGLANSGRKKNLQRSAQEQQLRQASPCNNPMVHVLINNNNN